MKPPSQAAGSWSAIAGRMAHALPRGQTLPPDQFALRHRHITLLLWAHVVALPLVTLAYGRTVGHSVLEGAIVAPWAVLASLPVLPRRARALVAALGLMISSAVLVHVTDGLGEAHFHFFVMVTVLALYEDWTVFGIAIGFVLVHHAFDLSWRWAAVHAFFIGGLSLANLVVWRAAERVRERLAASNAELERFAHTASHDLSEPLHMISAHLRLLDRRHGEALDAEGRQLVANALEASGQMRELIEDLLAYSRVNPDGARREPVDAREAVDATLRSLAASLEGAEVEVAPLPVVQADPVQLRRLFQNLLSNAVKFGGPETPRVEVGVERAGAEWVFTVADNGIGVPPEHAERIFEMFQRLHPRDEYEGSGIGLATCRKIVELHGGRIWVEPRDGDGSRFCFTLPA